MTIAKEFDWEMGHRLPFHKGKCKNLHGHSYRALFSFEGEVDENGILIDFYDVKQIVKPVIELLDHAFVVHRNDTELIESLSKMNSKTVIFDFHSTAENICTYLLDAIKDTCPSSVRKISVRLFETADAYAEDSIELNH